MQRQSLGGSPGSKLHVNGGAKEEKILEEDQLKKKKKEGDDEDESKLEEKIHHHNHQHRSTFRTEKSIHLIPVLTIFCFLVLYLCSHDPTPKDLIQFNGFRASSMQLDSTTVSELERYMEIGKGDVLALRGHRSLQEAEDDDARKSRFHRKIGGF